MNRQNLEEELLQLGATWPVPSVVDAVMGRIHGEPLPYQKRPGHRRRNVLLAVAASLLVAVGLPFVFLVGTSHTLQAQVTEALKQTSAARLIISALDEQGVRRQGRIWYSHGRGFRLEASDETVVDDGKHQWTWRSAAEGAKPVVVRRASPGTSAMISEMFQLGNVPADWRRQRAKEHDREIGGQACEAFVVVPSAPHVASGDGTAPTDARHPLRFVVWQDSTERVVRIEQQRQFVGGWHAGREISIEYDVAVPAEKFAADYPANAEVIDADGALAERFPLERALATAQSGGLLFAVHEARRGEDDTWYVVSSVRGTPEYLKAHPPQRRRFNLQTTLLDVAKQPSSPGIDSGSMHRAVMATAEMDGVQYLWWLAVRRRLFTVEDGVRTPFEFAPPSLEAEPGRLSLELTANYWGTRSLETPPRVAVVVPLAETGSQSFMELAGHVRRDVLAISKLTGVVASLLGGTKDNMVGRLDIDKSTDKDIAEAIVSQITCLRDFDEVSAP